MSQGRSAARRTSRTVIDIRIDVLVEAVRAHRPTTIDELRSCPRVCGWVPAVFDQAAAEAIQRGVIIDSAGPGEPLVALDPEAGWSL